MSLRNNTAQGGVSSLDRLNGNITLEPGPGMTIIDNATTNSIRLSTTSQSVNLDTVLQNGDRSARTINLLTNVSDSFPTLSLHDNISLGNSKTTPDVSISYTDETPSGLKMTSGKIFRSDIIGAAVASSIQSKSGITIDPGMQLKTDYIDASTTGGKLQLNDVQLAMDKTLYTDNIRPTPSSPTRFINTGGIAVDPTYSVKASAYLPSGAFTNATMFRADDGTFVSTGTLSIDAAVQVLPNKLLKCDVFTSSTDSNDKLTFNMPAGVIGAPNILLNPVNSVKVLAGKPINCDQIIDTTSTKMVVDLANTTIQASQDILQSDTQIQNFKTANISGLNADSGITINAPIGGIGLTPTTVLNTDTIHAVSTDNQVNFTSHLSVDPKLHIKVKNVSDSDILLNPVGDVVVDPAKILKAVNIRSISDVVPITMSSDVNIGSIGTDTKTLNTDHIRPLTEGGRTDFSVTTMGDLKVATISPSVGGMTIDMNKASITSATLVDVVANLKAASLDTDAISTTSTITGMNIDLVNSNIASTAGVTVSNIKSQDATFSSITPTAKALAINGDIKMLQDATVYTDKLGASVAQYITVNNDMVINPANKLIADNIDVKAINNVNNPNGLRILTDQSTITSGSDMLVTPNSLFKVYGSIQTNNIEPIDLVDDMTITGGIGKSIILKPGNGIIQAANIIKCDTYQPLTIGGDITLSTIATANVILNNQKPNKLIALPGNDIIVNADVDKGIRVNLLRGLDNSSATITFVPNGLYIVGYRIYLGNSDNGEIQINNNGLRFRATGSILNDYEEDEYVGTLANSTPATTQVTFKFSRIGNIVTVSLVPLSSTFIITTTQSLFSVTIPTIYRPASYRAVLGRLASLATGVVAISLIITGPGLLFIDASGPAHINLNDAMLGGSYCL